MGHTGQFVACTLRQPIAASPFLQATRPDCLPARLFSSSDDLALDLPTAQDKPSIQRWDLKDLDNDGTADDPLARQSRGDYSWIVTVSPDHGRRSRCAGHRSIGLFLTRCRSSFSTNARWLIEPPDRPERRNCQHGISDTERATVSRRKIVSTGLNGGEVLVDRQPPTDRTHSTL